MLVGRDLRPGLEPVAALALFPLMMFAAVRSDAMRAWPKLFGATERYINAILTHDDEFNPAAEPIQGDD